MSDIPSPRPVSLTPEEVLSLSDTDLVEYLVIRVAGLLVKASAVTGRSEHLPCLDYWATRERLARIDDVLFSGQRLLQRLSAT